MKVKQLKGDEKGKMKQHFLAVAGVTNNEIEWLK